MILIIDDFLNKEELQKCKDEIRKSEKLFKSRLFPTFDLKTADLDRVYNNRKESSILQIVEKNLFSSRVKELMKKQKGHPYFSLLPFTTIHSTNISAHKPKGMADWHTDNVLRNGDIDGQILNYVIYIDMGGKFSEGNLEVSYEQIGYKKGKDKGTVPARKPKVNKIIKFKDNRFVIFPTDLWHRITTIKCKKYNGILDGRISINGHIGFMG